MTESEIKREILLELSRNRNIMLWNNPTAVARPYNSARFVRFGNPGESDLLGLIAPWGIALAIECKSRGGRLSDRQKQWGAAFSGHGGIYVVAHSVPMSTKLLGNTGARLTKLGADSLQIPYTRTRRFVFDRLAIAVCQVLESV